jgi:hypothetical protein
VNAPRIVLAIAVATIAGCAALSQRAGDGANETAVTHIVTAERARDAVTIGRSTRADVLAALGPASIVRFDSGYEVWVYRLARSRPVRADPDKAAPEPRGEFVILFAPAGLATKVRWRPAVAPG